MAGIVYSIEFAAAIARLEAGTREATKHVKRMAGDIDSASSFARNALLTVAGALGVHSFSSWIKGAADAAEASAKLSDRFGIQTQAMVGMQHAAALANTSNEALTAALRGIALEGTNAARGSEEARRTFRQLNIEYAEFVKLPLDQQFSMVIDRLGKVENVALRNALAQQAMGKSAGEVMNMVAEGSGAIARATEDAKAWGLALNRVDAAKVEMAKDAMTRAEAAARGIATTISVTLAPLIATFGNRFADAARDAQGFKKEIGSALESVAVGAVYVLNAVRGLEFGWVGLKWVIASVADVAVQAMHSMAKAIVESKIAEWAQYIPGPVGMAAKAMRALGQATVDSLGEAAHWTRQNVESIAADLQAIGERGIVDPEEVRARFRKLLTEFQAQAQAIALARQTMNAGSDIPITQDQNIRKDTWGTDLERRVERIRQGNMLELEALNEGYSEKSDALNQARAQGLIDEDFYNQQSFQLNWNHQSKLQELARNRHQAERSMQMATVQMAGELLQQWAGKSKTAAIAVIAISKGLAIAQTIQSTAAAAMRAMAELGPTFGPPAAAKIKIMGAIQVGLIAATGLAQAANVGSGGADAGSPANPVSTTEAALPPAQTESRFVQTTIINIPPGFEQQTHSGVVIRDFIAQLAEATRDGGRVVIAD